MDLPGKSGSTTDTPKAKKHREQLIVVGTVVLVILTFMMVSRRGSNAGPVGAGGVNGFTPDESGGSGGGPGDMSYLPAMLGALPGQVAALEQGNAQQEHNDSTSILDALSKLTPQTVVRTVTKKAPAKKAKKHKPAPKKKPALHPQHPSRSAHPKAPAHPISVSHHTPVHATTGRKAGKHPPQHHAPARARLG